MRRSLLLLLAVAGCGSRAAVDPCRELGDTAKRLVAEWSTANKLPAADVDLAEPLAGKCRSDRWSAHAVRCLTAGCDDPAPHATALAFIASILATRPGPAGALAEAGPHPDYPTPVAAGTANLFLLEEPDRGPPLPSRFAPPARSTLAWATAGYCELTMTSATCSDTLSGAVTWNIGTRPHVTVVEQRYGAHVLATMIFERDDKDAPLRTLELDAHGRLARAAMFRAGMYSVRLENGGNGLDGCGAMAYEMDAAQRLTSLACEQWTGGAMLDTSGVASYRFERNLAGFVAETTTYGVDGKLLANNRGIARTTFVRDGRGRPLTSRYFDAGGKRVADPDGCAGERITYDAEGAATRTTCLDAAGKPVGRTAGGVATRELAFDARGCLVGTRALDRAEVAMADLDGIAGEDLQNDAHCAVTRRTCVDVRGDARACGPGKPAQKRYVRDAAGRPVSTTHFDHLGQPTLDPEFEAFEIRSAFDPRGNEISTSCFDGKAQRIDCDGTGFHEKRRTFDANGRQLEETFFNTQGARATNLGATSRRYRYDNYDHPYESQSFDAAGNPVEQMGTATVRQLYDVRHQRFAVVLLDVKGKPASYSACFTGASCPDKPWHAVRIVRLGDGTLDYNQFFDAEGQLMEAISCRTEKCFD